MNFAQRGKYLSEQWKALAPEQKRQWNVRLRTLLSQSADGFADARGEGLRKHEA